MVSYKKFQGKQEFFPIFLGKQEFWPIFVQKEGPVLEDPKDGIFLPKKVIWSP
jgi:hypothetical protein